MGEEGGRAARFKKEGILVSQGEGKGRGWLLQKGGRGQNVIQIRLPDRNKA